MRVAQPVVLNRSGPDGMVGRFLYRIPRMILYVAAGISERNSHETHLAAHVPFWLMPSSAQCAVERVLQTNSRVDKCYQKRTRIPMDSPGDPQLPTDNRLPFSLRTDGRDDSSPHPAPSSVYRHYIPYQSPFRIAGADAACAAGKSLVLRRQQQRPYSVFSLRGSSFCRYPPTHPAGGRPRSAPTGRSAPHH